MSFSTLVVVGLLHFVGSAQGFSGVSGARFVSQRPRVLPALRAVNEFDAWQAARGALTTDAPGALPLSTDNVALVLGEFARSDFARRLCKPGYDLNDQPDEGQVGAVFESARLADATLIVKLQRSYGQRSEVLMERLARYLRVRLPQLGEIRDDSGDDFYVY